MPDPTGASRTISDPTERWETISFRAPAHLRRQIRHTMKLIALRRGEPVQLTYTRALLDFIQREERATGESTALPDLAQ